MKSVKPLRVKKTPVSIKYSSTFTKATMSIIYMLYVFGALLGGVLVTASALLDAHLGLQIDTGMFIAYAAYLGTPTAVAIGFYAWKSKAENLLKIKGTIEEEGKDGSELIGTLANMKGGDT